MRSLSSEMSRLKDGRGEQLLTNFGGEQSGASESQRQATQAAVHLAELRHVENERIESAGAQLCRDLRESGSNQNTVVDANAVGSVALFGADRQEREAAKPLGGGHLFHDDEGVVADIGDAALEVKNSLHGSNVEGGRGIAEAGEMRGELARALLVGPLGDAEEEVLAGLADVATVDGARRVDGEGRRKKLEDRVTDGVDFTLA